MARSRTYRKSLLSWTVAVGCLAIALLVTSCNDTDDNPQYRDASVTNLVTYVGQDGGAVFDYISIDDAPPVRLYTDANIDTDVSYGQRYLMTYYPVNGDDSESGFVTPLRLAPVTTLGVSEKDISMFPDWDKYGVYLMAAWRTGTYLNIRCKLPVSDSPRLLALVTSEENDGALYLVHQAPDDATFDRTYYISFDMAGYLSEHPSLGAVEVHINNTNLKEDVITFPISK